MGKKFFSDWALWQQMTFVLACGIVVTIIVGLIKLRYDNYRIAKYSKVQRKEKPTPTPEMLEAQREEPSTKEEDIPFGIRAIESGIEVDGVWISRSNTPAGSSAASSLNEARLGHSQNNSQIELPRPAYASSSRESSRAPSTRTPSSAFERATSAERIPSDSRSSSPGRSHGQSRYTRNSATLQALEGLDIAGPSTLRYEPVTNGQYSPPGSGNTSGRTSDESSDYVHESLRDSRPYEPAYIKPGNNRLALPVPVDPRMDLNLLQSHRLSHVAETGQLTPRVRRPGQSGDWANSVNIISPDEILTSNTGVNYFVPRKTPSPPHEVYAKEEVTSHVGMTYTYDTPTSKGKEPVDTHRPQPAEAYRPQTYEPRGPQHVYETEENPDRYVVPTSQNQRQSHVLRKVNSGFEILRPGTFGPPTAEEIAEEKRQSRRLQKKRRPSDVSRGSQGD